MHFSAVIPAPKAQMRLKRGFDTVANLLALTLGPSRGHILSSTAARGQVEMLSDAATIARRIIALPDRAEDVGAMILRNLVWRTHARVGDGGATTAVMAQAILQKAVRYVSGGANAMLVQRGVRQAADTAGTMLSEMAAGISGVDELVSVAETVTGQSDLSHILGEMFDLLGPTAHVTVEDYTAPYLERSYIDGGHWHGSLASPYLISAPATQQAVLSKCVVAIFAGDLAQAEDINTLLHLAAAESPPHLLLVANKVAGEALNALVATHKHGKVKIVAAGLQRPLGAMRNDMDDLALLCGARVFHAAAGETLREVRREDLGRAQRVQAGVDGLYVTGGGGSARAIRDQVQTLQARLKTLNFDSNEQPDLHQRVARLTGSSAVLKIGAYTKVEREHLHQKAEQGLKALRAAMEAGLVPGGGVAYAHCAPRLCALRSTLANEDEWLGVKAVMHGLEAPFHRILANAHHPAPGVVLAELSQLGPGYVFDVKRAEIVPVRPRGLLDPVKVLQVALETAASGAMLALSTETVVLRKKPKVSLEP